MRLSKLNCRMNRQDFNDTRTDGSHRYTKAERGEIYNQLAKKFLREKGIIGPKIPGQWTYNDITVTAHTRSEARAMLKMELGLKRLPVGAKIERVIV